MNKFSGYDSNPAVTDLCGELNVGPGVVVDAEARRHETVQKHAVKTQILNQFLVESCIVELNISLHETTGVIFFSTVDGQGKLIRHISNIDFFTICVTLNSGQKCKVIMNTVHEFQLI